MKTPYLFILAFLLAFGISRCKTEPLKQHEKELVLSGIAEQPMRLLSIENNDDSLFLRQEARKIKKSHISNPNINHLKMRMLSTVTNPENEGVGIAAPQIGVSLQMIYVQRFDKEGEPFEIYFNPKIETYGDSINSGLEGCLSVPGYRGRVDRSQNIVISYIDSLGQKQQETVNDFTAVIFQHEIDHLKGMLYFDHIYDGFNSLNKTE
jgi:peptide deformylase